MVKIRFEDWVEENWTDLQERYGEYLENHSTFVSMAQFCEDEFQKIGPDEDSFVTSRGDR